MLAKLHEITQSLLLRKQSQWSDPNLFQQAYDIKELDVYCQKRLLKELKKLEKKASHWSNLEPRLKNLCHINQQLSQTPWQIPRFRTAEAKSFFINDLLFTLFITHTIDFSYQIFTGYYADYRLPPTCLTHPNIHMSHRGLKQILRPLFQDYLWLEEKINRTITDIPTALCELEHMRHKIISSNKLAGLMDALFSSTHVLSDNPNNAFHLTILRKIHSTLNEIAYNQTSWPHYRLLTIHLLLLPGNADFSGKEYEILYSEIASLSEIDYAEELCVWKNTIEQIYLEFPGLSKNNHNQIYKLIDYIQEQSLSAFHNTQRLEWTAHPHEFARTFCKLIDNGQIKLNGCSDILPIVHHLDQCFVVQTAGRNGYMQLNSLQTYFKKVHVGDI